MSNRINYLDGLRGFTMLLVVYSHLLVIAFNTTPGHNSAINEVLLTFRMPLFFFISGFFLYRAGFTADLLRRRSKRRLVRQLCPTLIVGALFCIAFRGGHLIYMCFDTYKYGYWFTFVSVEMFFIAAPMLYLFDRWRISNRLLRLAIFIIVGLAASMMLKWQLSSGALDSKALSLALGLASSYHLFSYLIYFFAGMAFKMCYDRLERPLSCVYTLLVAVTVMAAVHMTGGGGQFNPDEIFNNWLKAFAGILTAITAFNLLYKTRFGSGRLAQRLENIGRSTLEIYLLHYFIICILAKLPGDRLSLLKGTLWEFPVFFPLTVCVVAICMYAVYILKKARLYRYIFPDITAQGPPSSSTIEAAQ